MKPSKEKPKQLSTYLFSQHGADFEPGYTLRHLDPDQHASRNRYAAALYDAFGPEVLYAEVLLIPEWTQPPPLSEQAKANGAVPPPPEPILPSQFAIQLYNPDQQIVMRHRPASFNKAAAWEFEIPQQTFRAPSGSTLDRTQHDPFASEVTPKIVFKWKKDSKFSKDLACFMSGKSTDIEGKAKHRDPDITVSIFKGLKELTLYEPNLQRVDIEDMKGFEVVLLLGAVVIRDVYFGSLKETFNLNAGKNTSTSPSTGPATLYSDARPHSSPVHDPRIPPTDPRTQWELEAESARLRKQALDEERQLKRRQQEEEQMTRQMLEREETDQQRRRQAQIEQETQWLQRMYGQEDASVRPNIPPRDPRQQRHHSEAGQSAYAQTQVQHPVPQFANAWGGNAPPGPYMSGAASQSSLLTPVPSGQQRVKQKSSIFNFRRRSDDEGAKLQRKRSAVF